jgi:hypothetical protein
MRYDGFSINFTSPTSSCSGTSTAFNDSGVTWSAMTDFYVVDPSLLLFTDNSALT